MTIQPKVTPLVEHEISSQQKFTILVTLFEGRYFLKQPSSKIYLQCRFNNEILTTDPVDFSTDPIWDTELAWEMDGKTLRYLRTQRAMLKLQCFSLSSNNQRELVGYIMLDLRQAQDIPAKEKWLPLVHLKTLGFRPEVRLSFSCASQEKVAAIPTFAPTRSAVPVASNVPAIVLNPKRALQQTPKVKDVIEQIPVPQGVQSKVTIPVTLTSAGYYQIGEGHSFYLFTATIGFAGNLLGLLPNPLRLASLKNGFYFYYNMLGSTIVTERFFDLSKPSFTGERVMIRIRSSPESLKTFFKQLHRLTIYLCHEADILGYTDIPVDSCFNGVGVDRVVVDALYPVASVGQSSPAKPNVQSTPPSLGVTLSLEKELADPYTRTPSPTRPIYLNSGGDKSPEPIAKINKPEAGSVLQPGADASLSKNHPQIPPTWHQFRLAVDLRSISNLKVPYDGLYCKYAYAPLTGPDVFFAENVPSTSNNHMSQAANAPIGTITTYPPTHVFPEHDNLLPHSFCSFEFIMDPSRLTAYLDSLPLRVEVWARATDASGSENETNIGSATALMDGLFRSTKQSVPEMGVQATRRRFESVFEIFDASAVKIGDLTIVFVLEDFGAHGTLDAHAVVSDEKTTADEVAFSPSMVIENVEDDPVLDQIAINRSKAGEPRPPPARTVMSYTQSGKPVNIRQTQEYHAVIELETWKQTEREKFEQRLKEKEAKLLGQLGEEFQQNELERQQEIRERVSDLQKMEAKAASMIKELEEREHRYRAQEEEFHNKQREIEQTLTKHVTEARDNARRLTDEFAHQIKIERIKIEDYERQIQVVREEKKALEKEFKTLENEFLQYRQRSLTTTKKKTFGDEAKLKSEIDQLNVEKKRIEEEITVTEKSKRYYKQAWMKALQDVNELRQSIEDEKKSRLEREQRELEHMRLRYLAKEEAELERMTTSSKAIVDPFKQPITLDMGAALPVTVPVTRPITPADLQRVVDPDARAEAERLLNEKQSLLKTGVYNDEDTLVRTLNEKLQSIVASR